MGISLHKQPINIIGEKVEIERRGKKKKTFLGILDPTLSSIPVKSSPTSQLEESGVELLGLNGA